ncbi:methylated-DNA--[protein]-cysteine S-methyltransferase [Phenylobacterium aquaticum]|uniref:methylated-DNA--[protein]-cysteine S-methyltransferase n=1 Tax=Phenylobacterium aquaticum TaxID=1763816 RepID=UPI001F5E1FD8|nr:methylated-DNA--[protein]-cysteine S-methyltransferase [Phenylobacterium aquaticum]MCI3134742.1 methylated-DNA--[protein]-cysteine S-methyltransferase [Phenylobacterium aquaticum]
MTPPGFALFDTAIGLCGVVWNPVGLIGTLLPEGDGDAARARIARRWPAAVAAAPSPEAAFAISAITALMVDGRTDLTGVTLDMGGLSDFLIRVYAAARAVPPGQTRTYGEIAAAAGAPREARAVGQAMGRNPWPIVVPCHRVMGAGGKLVGFSAPGGTDTKLKLLSIEQARLSNAPGLFDDLGGLPIGVRPGT